MPRETIRQLSEDTERLLVAGAHLAAGSADLGRDKEALTKLIAKLGAKSPPVFAKLNDQIDKVLTAKPKEQASELVSLMTSVATVRAGLAQLAHVAATDTALTAVPAIQTPCNARDLYALHDALVTKGQGRMEKIDEAVERGDVADLRLVHAVIQAIGDGYVGDTVSDKVVPKFGRAIIDPVRSKLRFSGKKVDGRRLRALVAVERHGARALVEQALKEGSAEMREAALDAIADHMPGVPEFEAFALSTLEKERTGDVRRAAVRALGGYSSDESLEKLLAAVDDERTYHAAGEALGKSKHKKVVDGLIDRLQKAVAGAKAKPKKTDKPGLAKQVLANRMVSVILEALTPHKDKRIPPIARELLDDHGTEAADCLIGQGNPDDVRLIADRLYADDSDLFDVAARAATKGSADDCADRFLKVLKAKDRGGKLGGQRVSAVWSAFEGEYDYEKEEHKSFKLKSEKWVDGLLKIAKEADAPYGIFNALGQTKDPRASAPLLARLAKGGAGNAVSDAIHGLAELGEKKAIDPILEHIKSDRSTSWAARRALLELADAKTVDKVRTVYAALKDPEAYKNWPIRSVLHQLERKFPGH